jgi:putative PIN family toxin of toxin-antitoxin system
MRIVLDTNVIYQALRSRSGASYAILQLVRNGQLEIAISVPVFLEYSEVLTRATSLRDLNLTDQEVESFLRFISYIVKPFDISFLMRPNLSDESDNMFVDLALSSNSRFLVTSNINDFTRGNELIFDDFQVSPPGDFISHWRSQNE